MEDNIKNYLKETGSVSVDWGHPAQCMEQCLICDESNQYSSAEEHAENC